MRIWGVGVGSPVTKREHGLVSHMHSGLFSLQLTNALFRKLDGFSSPTSTSRDQNVELGGTTTGKQIYFLQD